MEQSNGAILLIDDNKDTCEFVELMFKTKGFRVNSCLTAEEGVNRFIKGGIIAVVLDEWLEETSGIKVCREIRSLAPNVPIVFFSGDARPQEIQKALDAGANAFLVKARDVDKLTDTVINLIEIRK